MTLTPGYGILGSMKKGNEMMKRTEAQISAELDALRHTDDSVLAGHSPRQIRGAAVEAIHRIQLALALDLEERRNAS